MKKIKYLVLVILTIVLSIFNVNDAYAQSKDIDIIDVTIKESGGEITAENPTISNEKISGQIKFKEVGDFVTFELTLKNNESEKYKIRSITDNNENDNISIEYFYSNDFIDKNETANVIIKMIYKKKLVNKNLSLNDLSIKLEFEKEDGTSSELILNPKTLDGILHYVGLLIISVIGIFLIIAKKRKIGTLLLILPIILFPFSTTAREKYDICLKFTDIEVKGEFETYQIAINSNNGNDVIVREITYGQSIGELPNLTKEGYNFDSWVDNQNNKVTAETIVTKQTEINAKWKPEEYAISYDLNGGKLPEGKSNPTKYTIESEDITLVNPIKVGYTFSGWTGTEIDTQTTSIIIPSGSKNVRNYVAHYSANENTTYKVIHRYQKLDDLNSYTEQEVIEHGATDTEVMAPLISKTGFALPTSQNVTIKGDGSALVTYTYNRKKYSFSIADRTYIDNISTIDGIYPYETSITIKAKERNGYSFIWSDGNTNYERTFKLEEEKELTPIYIANTNTPYVVKHYKQNLSLDGYDLVDTQELTGTTDTLITPATNEYEGFLSPEIQNVTIAGDGNTEVVYKYNRELYNFSFNNNEFVSSTKEAGVYPYGTEITLTASERVGYKFEKWSNNQSANTYTFIINSDLTLEPSYIANTYYVSFNGNGGEDGYPMNNQKFTYDSDSELNINTYKYSGYKFKEWNTEEDGSGDSYVDKETISNLTSENNGIIELFAQWEIDKSGTTEWLLHPEESEFTNLNTPNRPFVYGSINPFFLIGSQNDLQNTVITKLGFYISSVSDLNDSQYITVSVFKDCIKSNKKTCTVSGTTYDTLGGTGLVSKQKVYIPISELSSTTVNKWINIDVNIPIGENEILGISMHDDPVILKYTKEGNTPSVPNKYYFSYRIGDSDYLLRYDNSLTINVEVYHPTNQELLYNALKGKKYSILGDSISTFPNWSNNTDYNNTIGSNALYYKGTNILTSVNDTYWKQLIDSYDLDLVVNNSYSGNRMFTSTRGTAGYLRAEQLHNNDQEIPELVTIYLGINDLDNYGTKILGTISDVNMQAYIDSKNGSTYNYSPVSFADAYAYAIYKIIDKYDNPDIFLLNFIPNATTGGSVGSNISSYNAILSDIVNYYHDEGYSNVVLVDQYNYGDASTNYSSYTGDTSLLHPNKKGMELLKNALEDYMIDYYINHNY